MSLLPDAELLQVLAKSAVLAGVGLLVARGCRAHAAREHAVLALTIVFAAGLPWLGLWVSLPWSLGFSAAAEPLASALPVLPPPSTSTLTPAAETLKPALATTAYGEALAAAPKDVTPPTWRPSLPFLWALGSAACLAHLLFGHWRAANTRRNAVAVSRGLWTHPDVDGAILVGLWSPRVIVSERYREWGAETFAAVLAHERAHAARRDLWWSTLARLCRAFIWPNLLLWVAIRRMSLACELACDDAVVREGGDALDYADALVRFARDAGARADPRGWSAAAALARPSSIEQRVRRVLDRRAVRAGAGRPSVLLGLGMLIAGVWVTVPTQSLADAIERPRNEREDAGAAPQNNPPRGAATTGAAVATSSQHGATAPTARRASKKRVRKRRRSAPERTNTRIRNTSRSVDPRRANLITRGPIEPDVVDAIVAAHALELSYCYRHHLGRGPSEHERAKLKFTIGHSGYVHTAVSEPSSLTDPAAMRCLVNAVRRWKFPVLNGNSIVALQYPRLRSTAAPEAVSADSRAEETLTPSAPGQRLPDAPTPAAPPGREARPPTPRLPVEPKCRAELAERPRIMFDNRLIIQPPVHVRFVEEAPRFARTHAPYRSACEGLVRRAQIVRLDNRPDRDAASMAQAFIRELRDHGYPPGVQRAERDTPDDARYVVDFPATEGEPPLRAYVIVRRAFSYAYVVMYEVAAEDWDLLHRSFRASGDKMLIPPPPLRL